jgi:D-sedoheptulose 7-phosphate isomerase
MLRESRATHLYSGSQHCPFFHNHPTAQEEAEVPSSLNPSVIFQRAVADNVAVIQAISMQQAVLERTAGEMTCAIFDGENVLWCGNGGSAADSQHLAAELMGRFRRERRGLRRLR